MNDPVPFDDFQALIDGRLDAASAAAPRARIDADAALRAEFEAYRDVHAFTAPAATAAPVSSVTFARLDAARRAERLRRLRPWMAAAAALLVATAGAAEYVRMQPHVVALHAIRLTETCADCPPITPIPATLATFRPVVDGKLNWMTSLDDARAVARASGRPLFVWVYHSECPMCRDLDRDAMRDAAVVAKAGEFVPVKIDVMKAPREVEPWLSAGWPYLGVQTADGRRIEEFAGEMDKSKIKDDLARGESNAAAALPWDTTNETAALYAQAEDALRAGRYGDAYRGYDEIRRRVGNLRPAVLEDAETAVSGLEREAHDVLLESKKLAATDEAAGARRLSEAAERFRGTPYGLDLAEVEQELRATGRFPVLVEAARDAK